jgi:hypothetical protein
MQLRPWIFRISILAALVVASAMCAGWKWTLPLPH